MPAEHRSSIIKAVTNPLGFFVLILLLVEATLLANLAVVPQDVRQVVLASAIIIIVLTLLLVAGIAIWRPEALYGQRRETADFWRSLAADVCTAYDAYVSNLETDEERSEAWDTLVALVEQEGAAAHQETRSTLGRAIRDRAAILNR